jgi:hypothetical protein
MSLFAFAFIFQFNFIFPLLIQLAAVFLISNTSGMILSVAGPIKDIMVIITSATAFGSPVSNIQVQFSQYCCSNFALISQNYRSVDFL